MSHDLLRKIYWTLHEARGHAYIGWLQTRPIGCTEEKEAYAWYEEASQTLNEYEAWLEVSNEQLYTSLRAGHR